MSTIINLGKIRFQFRGDYDAAIQYEYNDVVRYGGDLFCYINVTATIGTLPTTTSHWSRMVSGLLASGAWDSATAYAVNQVVTHGGNTYRATAATTNNVPPNASYWELLAGGYDFKGNWAATTAYKKDDAVVFQGSAYRATTNFTSASTLLADLTAGNWERYAQGTFNAGTYATSTDYFKGDLVQTGTAPNLDHFICLADHTSDASSDPGSSPEDANWTRLIAGQYTTSNADRQYAYFIGVGF
ncbi:MAG TPA: hypothetical protein DEP13_04790 [Gammaproteobacteria bacterium]|nr:MAG: hypothetical protein CBD74_05890 [Saprospirales bacterium TMED214]HCA35942.1 hypothetical protein [Gammaproteobacteria bacterium]